MSYNYFFLLSPEKGRNERILAEEYHKRKELEAELEEATSKYRVVSEKHAKVKEAVNVTELKVTQTQAQVKMYEHHKIIVRECPQIIYTTIPIMVTIPYHFCAILDMTLWFRTWDYVSLTSQPPLMQLH